ncbi:MAG: hypothetical protein HQL82_12735, partial [Magnetococcales bacterium]|nr:hypothetical protein [Magnetococcales bacterium]
PAVGPEPDLPPSSDRLPGQSSAAAPTPAAVEPGTGRTETVIDYGD